MCDDDVTMCNTIEEMTACGQSTTMCGGCHRHVLEDHQTAYGYNANLCTSWYHQICLTSDKQTLADLSIVGGL